MTYETQGHASMEKNEALTQAISFKLDFATGYVDPQSRIETGEIRQDRVEELKERILLGLYDLPADPEEAPYLCMDVRPTEDGKILVGLKAASGTFSLVAGDALTSNRLRMPGDKAPGHLDRTILTLAEKGRKVGGHFATSAQNAEQSGCGASDNTGDQGDKSKASALGRIVSHGNKIFSYLSAVGLSTTQQEQETITENAKNRIKEGYATTGAEINRAGAKAAGKENYPTLDGDLKKGVLCFINGGSTVLDHKAIEEDFGTEYKVFEVSAAAIANGCRDISIDEAEAQLKTKGALAYNLAVASTLVSPSMEFIYRPDPLQVA